jgi:hypothetical protein
MLVEDTVPGLGFLSRHRHAAADRDAERGRAHQQQPRPPSTHVVILLVVLRDSGGKSGLSANYADYAD